MGQEPADVLRRHDLRGLATGRALLARPGSRRMASGTHAADSATECNYWRTPPNVEAFGGFITIAQASGMTASKGPGGSLPVEASCIDHFGKEPSMPAQANTRLGVTLVGSGIHNNSDGSVHFADCC